MSIDNIFIEQREIEEHFAYDCLISSQAVLDDCAWLDPEVLLDKDIKEFWRKIKAGELATQEDVVAYAMTTHIDNSRNVLFFRLHSRCGDDPTALMAKNWAQEIVKRFYLRSVFVQCESVIKRVYQLDVNGVQEAVRGLGELQVGDGNKSGLTPDVVHQEFLGILDSPAKAVKCYLPAVDELIGGFYAGELAIFFARPGVGKTALLLQIARNIACSGKKVLFMSIEMSRDQLWARMACGNAGVDWVRVRAGDATKEEVARLKDESEALAIMLGKNLIIDDNPGAGVYEIHQSVILNRPEILIVDQLPDIKWHDSKAKQVEWLGEACKYIKYQIARPAGIPALVIHQSNRNSEARADDDKRPTISDLRASGEIEQRADIVLGGYRRDLYEGRSKDVFKVPFELMILKHRQANAGKVEAVLDYDLKAQWFC